jgi:internalin A
VLKKLVSPDARYTIEALLKVAQTDNCQSADSKLSSLTSLELRDGTYSNNFFYPASVRGKIADLRPLAGFTNLRKLILKYNSISDLQPLTGLTKLTELDLSSNNISDLRPIAKLNQKLNQHQVVDVRPLARLSRLSVLILTGNSLTDKTCPVQPNSICKS